MQLELVELENIQTVKTAAKAEDIPTSQSRSPVLYTDFCRKWCTTPSSNITVHSHLSTERQFHI